MARGGGPNFGGFNSSTQALFIARPGAGARLARDQKGRYANLQTQAKYAHELMAKDAAKSIQNELRDRIQARGRQQNVGPGRNSHLIRAINAPKNRVASADGFAVMLFDYMNSSKAAPYWRNLEEGSRVHVGREFRGYFLSKSGRVFPPIRSERFHVHGRLIQMGSTFGSRPGNAGQIGRGPSGRGTKTSTKPGGEVTNDGPGFRIIIRKPIPAYRYVEKGAADFISATAFESYYQRAFKDVPYKPVAKKPRVSKT